MQIWKTLGHYGSTSLEDAIAFYNKSPDGQYDSMVADLLQAILDDLKEMSELLTHRAP